MKLGVVFLLPFLSFCLCFENFILLLGSDISSTSILAGFSFVFHSLQIPLFVVILYETSYRLHEVRAVQFCCIPFDQGSNMNQFLANISVYVIRIIAILLFVTNIFVDFEIYLKSHDSIKVGRGGYAYLAKNDQSLPLILSLVPPAVLSAIAIPLAHIISRFGSNHTLGLSNRRNWKALLLGAYGQAVGQCFGNHVYTITSNAGELGLLIATTYFVYLVQQDLTEAGLFADYLHKSNIAFSALTERPASVTQVGGSDQDEHNEIKLHTSNLKIETNHERNLSLSSNKSEPLIMHEIYGYHDGEGIELKATPAISKSESSKSQRYFEAMF
eukprot:gene9861-13268_t